MLQEVGEGDVIDEESQELDAFIDGKNRPSHLDSATLEYPDDDESWRPAKPCFARARMLK